MHTLKTVKTGHTLPLQNSEKDNPSVAAPPRCVILSRIKQGVASLWANALTFIEKIFLSALLITLVLVFLMMGAHGQETIQTEIPEKIFSKDIDLNDLFQQADIIADGRIDPGEFDIHHFNVFKALDDNKDGRLIKSECLVDCVTHQSRAGHEGTKEKAEILRHLEFAHTPYRYDAIDIDGSGDIVVYEYILFGRDRFPGFDKNKSGFIENSEFCSGYRSSMPCDYSDKEVLQ